MFQELIKDNGLGLNPSIAYRQIETEVWLASSPQSDMYKLNQIGALVWNALTEGKTIDALIDEVCRTYDVGPEIVGADVHHFLAQLYATKLLTVNDRQKAVALLADEFTGIDGLEPQDRGLLIEAAERHIPIRVQFELTQRCNLNCRYCAAPKASRDFLSTQEVLSILDQLAANGCLFLTLTGGEVFSRRDFPTILAHAGSLNFGIALLTNGTLISPALAREISSIKTMQVSVSLHSTLPETHDAFAGVAGSFHKALRAIEALVAEGVPTTVFYNVTDYNFQEAEDFKELADRLGAELLCNVLIIPTFEREVSPVQYRASDEGIRHVMRLGLFTPQRTRCSAGKSRAKITATGDVTPCEIVNIVTGNVRDSSFGQVWHSEQLMDFLGSAWFDVPSRCKDCAYFDDCLYCPGLAYLESCPPPAAESCRLARLYASDTKAR